MKKTVIITMGDPKGIGPEIIIKALASKPVKTLLSEFAFLIVGSEKILSQTARKLDAKFEPVKITEPLNTEQTDKTKDILLYEPASCQSKTDPAQSSLECILNAIDLMKANKGTALVTAPVSKQAIQESGFPFTGHTEILAQKTLSRRVTMMFVSPQLKVSLATTHIAYRKLLLFLTADKILSAIEQTDEVLRRYFNISQPKLAVCGLNPHSGEGRKFGNEEDKIIKPAIQLAQNRKIKADGPFPPDSIFYRALNKDFDAVVALYHDQGLIPIKTLGFFEAVQVTLGLPFIRTSPAHGVAYDIAGKCSANPSSMIEAIKLACSMTRANDSLI